MPEWTHAEKTESHYFIGTRDDSGEVSLSLPLTLDHGFDDTGMVRAQVHEAVGDAGVP